MLDVKNPDINVDEVMQRIQEKVRLRRSVSKSNGDIGHGVMPVDDWSAVEQSLTRAQASSQVGASLPPMTRTRGFRRIIAVAVAKIFLRIAQIITRDQRAFNQALLEAARTLSERLRFEMARVSGVATQLVAQISTREQAAANLYSELTAKVSAEASTTQELEERLRKAGAGREEMAANIQSLSNEVVGLGHRLSAVRADHEGAVREIPQQLEGVRREAASQLESRAQMLTEEFAALRAECSAALQSIPHQFETALSQVTKGLEAQKVTRESLQQLAAAAQDELARNRHAHGLNIAQLKTAVSLQERRVSLLLEEARKRLPKPFDAKQVQTFADELPHIADAMYLGFEDAFRGPREEIKRRVAIYVPKLRDAGAGSDRWPILDLGCGRGELLEVLGAEGLKGSGVDCNRAAVDLCRLLGLEVVLGDAFEVLSKIPDGSLGGLTAIQVVEHLPFELLLKLLDESLRVLRPGGIAIFETPNPNNIRVGATNFYVDPTHRNPVHPQTLHYLVEARGMVRVEALMLHPCPPEMHVPGDSVLARTFNEYFFGPQDYAVFGYRQ